MRCRSPPNFRPTWPWRKLSPLLPKPAPAKTSSSTWPGFPTTISGTGCATLKLPVPDQSAAGLAVLNCSQLVTLAGPNRPRIGLEMRDLAIVSDGAMLIREGRIQAVGSRAEIEHQITYTTPVVDAGGRIVLPGFVDSHTHAVFAGTRADEFEQRAEGATYAEIAARGGGIRAFFCNDTETTE